MSAARTRQTITLPMTGREFRAFLGAVLPHASTNDSFPPLASLTLDVADGVLHALATDRYTLGIARHPLPEGSKTRFTLTLPARALQIVVRQVKARSKVTVTLTPRGMVVEQTSDPVLSYHVPASDTDPLLPNWRSWIAERARRAPAPEVASPTGMGVNPTYLARFRAAVRNGLPLEMRPAGRALVVTCGTHFLGLISPIDLTKWRTEQGDPLDAWLPADAIAA